MGNILQCTPYSASSCTIKVVHSNPGGGGGGVVEYYANPSMHVADLMLDHPGQFVCDAARLTVGRRVPALPADEALGPRRLYFLLPMDLLYSVLTDEEAAALSCMAVKRAKKKGNKVRIFPSLGDHFCLLPAGEAKSAEEEPIATATAVEEEEEEEEEGEAMKVAAERMRRQRSWRPALDTIEEAG